MKSRRDGIFILCIVFIAAVLAGCGAAEQRPVLGKNRAHKPERQRFEGAFAGAARPTQACRTGVFRAFSAVWTAFMTA